MKFWIPIRNWLLLRLAGSSPILLNAHILGGVVMDSSKWGFLYGCVIDGSTPPVAGIEIKMPKKEFKKFVSDMKDAGHENEIDLP